MPATKTGITPQTLVAGVDGCRAGWVCVIWRPQRKMASITVSPDFKTLLAAHAKAAMMLVDMPIGLADSGRRGCEALTRARLGKRSSSVFAPPRRPMLAFDDYAAANAWGKAQGSELGGGVSKQAWAIAPKIHEVDEAIHPDDQSRLAEGHPELAFTRLGHGEPCRNSKRQPTGFDERLARLEDAGFCEARALVEKAKAQAGGGVAADDVLDACALALTAEARLRGDAWRLSDNARDARGLVMEIWG